MSKEQNTFVINAINGGQAIVSECDWTTLKGFTWYNYKGMFYCANEEHIWWGQNVRGKPLHWFVAKLMGFEVFEGFEVNYINHNKLDNRQPNLMVKSKKMDLDNIHQYKKYDSGYIGVNLDIENGKWMAHIRVDGESIYLGSYNTPEEASEVYQAEKKINKNRKVTDATKN